jgi:hypothetical protein
MLLRSLSHLFPALIAGHQELKFTFLHPFSQQLDLAESLYDLGLFEALQDQDGDAPKE